MQHHDYDQLHNLIAFYPLFIFFENISFLMLRF
jgi:hypothetical protein